MLIYIGADHRGFKLKESIKKAIQNQGYQLVDVGNEMYQEDDDYVDYAVLVAKAVQEEPFTRKGILICGSGAGMDIVANKFKGVRSVLGCNSDQVFSARNDDDVNVLCLAADFLDEDEALKIAKSFLTAPFSGENKFRRRIQKISDLENEF